MKFGDDVGRQHLISEEWDSHREKKETYHNRNRMEGKRVKY